jgi:hypothetical protein
MLRRLLIDETATLFRGDRLIAGLLLTAGAAALALLSR